MIDDFLDRLEHKAASAWEGIDSDFISAWKQSPVTRALLAQLEHDLHASLYQAVAQPEHATTIEDVALKNARNGARVEYIVYLSEIFRNPENEENREFIDVSTSRASGDSQT